MNTSSTRWVAFLVLGLGACVADEDGGWEVAEEQQALIGTSAGGLGGIGTIGTDIVIADPVPWPVPVAMTNTVFQSTSLNGKTLNGKTLNGKTLNGIHLGGMQFGAELLKNGRVEQGSLVADRTITTIVKKPKVKFGGKVDWADTVISVNQTLRGKQLEGAVLTAFEQTKGGQSASYRVRITEVKDVTELPGTGISAEWNPLHFSQSGVSYVYRVQAELPGKGGDLHWVDVCEPAANEPGVSVWALPVAGVWDENDGSRKDIAGQFSFACISGAIGKCYKWGYRPWVSADAKDAHQSCTRMARADYCGDGNSHTENGTEIDIADGNLSPQVHASAGPADFVREAWWKPDGAICVFNERLTGTDVTEADLQQMCGPDSPMRSCDGYMLFVPGPMLYTDVRQGTPFRFHVADAVLTQ